MWGLGKDVTSAWWLAYLQTGLCGHPSCVHHGGGPHAMMVGVVMALEDDFKRRKGEIK